MTKNTQNTPQPPTRKVPMAELDFGKYTGGPCYYVDVARGTSALDTPNLEGIVLLAGPFDNHALALEAQPLVEALARDLYPNDARMPFYLFGTCKVEPSAKQLPPEGTLNTKWAATLTTEQLKHFGLVYLIPLAKG